MPDELSPYAVIEANSRGRMFAEKAHPYRAGFDRDRDRIIHSYAFRRLEGKTQVFMAGVNDYYRTRLTHSIEVSQIGRSISKAIGLNESLTEAICLGHDLGHSPFGHAGEQVLNDLMGRFGGFEHNQQSLRIVEFLEHPYADFPGLNLMYETRLGLAKHRTSYDKPQDKTFSEANCSLEGQVAEIADRIAVSSHDLEDGMRAGLIDERQLADVELFARVQKSTGVGEIDDITIRRTRTAKAIIDELASDCIVTSDKAIEQVNINKVEEIYELNENLIVQSSDEEMKLLELEKFLLQRFYCATSLIQTAADVRRWLERLFDRLCSEPGLMPGYFRRFIESEGLERTVCDYISGMTDSFCLKMLEKI